MFLFNIAATSISLSLAIDKDNNLRRESGLDITDRIILYIDTDDRVELALKEHESLLMTEILATSVIYDSFPPKAMSEEHTLAETTVSLGITKVG